MAKTATGSGRIMATNLSRRNSGLGPEDFSASVRRAGRTDGQDVKSPTTTPEMSVDKCHSLLLGNRRTTTDPARGCQGAGRPLNARYGECTPLYSLVV